MAPSNAARVLVVEDQPVPREVLAKILVRDGYEVQTAATANDALRIGDMFRPDILLTDWLLQDNVNGLHVAERLRADYPGMSVIFLTGLPTDKLEAQAETVRPCKFIEKPCDFQELLQAIRELTPPAA